MLRFDQRMYHEYGVFAGFLSTCSTNISFYTSMRSTKYWTEKRHFINFILVYVTDSLEDDVMDLFLKL